MPLKPKLLLTSLIFVFIACALAVYVHLFLIDGGNAQISSSNSDKKEIGDFVLTDHDGNRVALSQFKGKLVLLAFGYTNCPDICPATLGKLKKVYSELGSSRAELRFLFISIDPGRDNVQRLKKHIPSFHHDFIGLTGTEEELNRIADIFSVAYFKEDDDGKSSDYLMNHPTSIYLISRDTKLISRYPHSFSPGSLVQEIREFL